MVILVALATVVSYILISLHLKNLSMRMYAKASFLLTTVIFACFKSSDFSLCFFCAGFFELVRRIVVRNAIDGSRTYLNANTLDSIADAVIKFIRKFTVGESQAAVKSACQF